MTSDQHRADAVSLHFEVVEPADLPFRDVRANLDDFAELVAMAHAVATLDEEWVSIGGGPRTPGPRAPLATDNLRVTRIGYGSPFVIDSELIEVDRQAVVGLTAVSVVTLAFAKSFKLFHDGRKSSADAAATRGNERREDIRFNRQEAEHMFTQATTELEPGPARTLRRAVGATPDADRKHRLRGTRFLKALWRLAQKDAVTLQIEEQSMSQPIPGLPIARVIKKRHS